jgi:hypothetical protein
MGVFGALLKSIKVVEVRIYPQMKECSEVERKSSMDTCCDGARASSTQWSKAQRTPTEQHQDSVLSRNLSQMTVLVNFVLLQTSLVFSEIVAESSHGQEDIFHT